MRRASFAGTKFSVGIFLKVSSDFV